MHRSVFLPLLVVVLVALAEPGRVPAGAAHVWDLPPGVPPPYVADLSALTPARVALGRQLPCAHPGTAAC